MIKEAFDTIQKRTGNVEKNWPTLEQKDEKQMERIGSMLGRTTHKAPRRGLQVKSAKMAVRRRGPTANKTSYTQSPAPRYLEFARLVNTSVLLPQEIVSPWVGTTIVAETQPCLLCRKGFHDVLTHFSIRIQQHSMDD